MAQLDSSCVGGFETRPYENHSGVIHILGTAAPQCGKSGIGTAPGTIGFLGTAAPQCGKSGIILKVITFPVTIGFPGTAAPQCGICSNKTEANRFGEQPIRGWFSRVYLPHFEPEHPPGAIQRGTACGSMSQDTLPGAIKLPGAV
ncbi:MAG: hypothetical protein NTV33_12090 [Coprothermobacterota bacterium]|nr:hypothetical protein [Coprothermobacterota bacterium]